MFEKIKRKWQKRIEKNAFKSTLSYTGRHGKIYTEEVYFKRSQPPFIERFGDWGRIYPPLKEDGTKIHKMNFIFGGWRNLIKLLIILGIVGMVILQFYDNFMMIEYLRETCQMNLIP